MRRPRVVARGPARPGGCGGTPGTAARPRACGRRTPRTAVGTAARAHTGRYGRGVTFKICGPRADDVTSDTPGRPQSRSRTGRRGPDRRARDTEAGPQWNFSAAGPAA